jgi:chromosome segregation ATPase
MYVYLNCCQVLKDMNQEVKNGYYGMLVDLFKCEELFYCAVEQTAGNKLFFHVVQNKHVATKIIQELNRSSIFFIVPQVNTPV